MNSDLRFFAKAEWRARWRSHLLSTAKKFEAAGVDAAGSIAPGRGRKPEIAQEVIDAVVNYTSHVVPDDESTAWSTRTMAERHGVEGLVARIWRARKLRPRTSFFPPAAYA